MIYEQYELAERTHDFIKRCGLKKGFVASECGIRREDFSKWLNHHYMLNNDQVNRVQNWVDDYERRLSA